MNAKERLKHVFANLEDPRVERTKKHPFYSILFIAICSTIAGIDDYVGMEDYCEENLEYFSSIIDLPTGTPSHDTIGRVLSKINITKFNEAFVEFTKSIAKKIPGVTAIDGKTARKSADKSKGKSALHSVSDILAFVYIFPPIWAMVGLAPTRFYSCWAHHCDRYRGFVVGY